MYSNVPKYYPCPEELGFSPEAREISCYLLSGSLISQTPQLISQDLGHHIGKVWRPDIDRGGT